jgi:peptidoglycan-associated lipoprotein
MKTRLLCMVAAIALLGACAEDKKVETQAATTAMKPTPPMTTTVKTDSFVPGSETDFEKNVGDKVFFDFDKSALTADAKAQLAKWADFLKKYPTDQFTIEGHCDERGTQEYNLALGDKRANAVKDFLVAQGIPTSRLKTISYGKERPWIAESNEAAWAKNRRAVGVVQ